VGIAAGVLLIITAIVNLIASMGYIFGGAVFHAFVRHGGLSANEGSALTGFGFFLMVSSGLQIAAGVVLFMNKGRALVLTTAFLGIGAEIGAMVLRSELLSMDVFNWSQVLGIGSSIFAVVAALLMKPRPPAMMMPPVPAYPYAPGYYPPPPGYGGPPPPPGGGYGPPPPYGPGAGPRFGG